MFFKLRTESDRLKILRSLNTRMNLPENDKQYYSNLKKGFEGEVMFDKLTEKLQSESLIVNDLLLKSNNTTFQIDSFIIQDVLYLFEIKNYEGDYYFEADNFYSMHETKIQNPLHQLNRCESLLSQLLLKHGYRIRIEAWVVFINPAFTLYQAPKNKPIIYPTQLDFLMNKLNASTMKLNNRHHKIADLLVSLLQTESPYTDLPNYDFDKIKKGLTCKACHSFLISVHGRKTLCDECGYEEGFEAAVMRSVRELKLLFPDRKITTNDVLNWCEMNVAQARISRILKKNLKVIGYGQWSTYE